MRVKICGITTADDGRAAVEAGADAVGLNFVGGPRRIEPEQAEIILAALPPFVVPVALVRLERERVPDALRALLADWGVRTIQVYGPLGTDGLAGLLDDGWRVMPVLAVRNERFTEQTADWRMQEGSTARPAAIVLDAYDDQREGGTGKTFCWQWVRAARDAGRLAGWAPIVLAGGLHPGNVAEAVRVVQPYAVDVSSGIEVDGAPGRKDPDKMRQFVHNAKHAEVAQ